MIKNSSWESLIWIIIWVFILSFIVFWITNLLINSKLIIENYDNKRVIYLLKNNTENILKNLELSNINENEEFYIYKNNELKEFEIFTWTLNQNYKYIDKYWNNIDDINLFQWDIYKRQLYIRKIQNILDLSTQSTEINIDKYIK